jgi:hypothetical protein
MGHIYLWMKSTPLSTLEVDSVFWNIFLPPIFEPKKFTAKPAKILKGFLSDLSGSKNYLTRLRFTK